MARDFFRVAILERGTTGVRFIQAVREFALAHGQRIETVALLTRADRDGLLARETDAIVDLGPPTFDDPRRGCRRSSYLDLPRIHRALVEARADAVWLGASPLAGHVPFLSACHELGLVLIGPGPDAVRVLGNTASARRRAAGLGIPVVPWADRPASTHADARAQANELGFPVVIKPCAGFGIEGLRIAADAAAFDAALDEVRAAGMREIGDSSVLLEQHLPGARHVEVHLVADQHGTVWPLAVRDASFHLHGSLLLAESPPPTIPADAREAAMDAAVRLARDGHWCSTGTVEFLLDAERGDLVFAGVSPRVPDELPATEVAAGVDMLALQLAVAAGEPLDGEPPRSQGHAISVRLEARDPDAGFRPSTGVVERLRPRPGTVLRVDVTVQPGDAIPQPDPTLAALTAHGRTRGEALARLRRALLETDAVVQGGTSTRGFLSALLEQPGMTSPASDVAWYPAWRAGWRSRVDHVVEALLLASADAYDAQREIAQGRFRSSAARGRPEVPSRLGARIALRLGTRRIEADVRRLRPRRYVIALDGVVREVDIERRGRFSRRLRMEGRRVRGIVVPEGAGWRIDVEAATLRVARADAGAVHAPAPAVVVSVLVHPGDRVRAGEPLVVLEAMKMEMPVVAPFDGEVRGVLVTPNLQVGPGMPLIVLEPAAEAPLPGAPADVDLGTPAPRPVPTAADAVALLRGLVLGYDVEPSEVMRAMNAADAAAPADDDRTIAEHRALSAFADVWSVFGVSPEVDEGEGEERPGEEWLLTYLRTPEARSRALPAGFLDALGRALAHYGITALTPGPALDQALMLLWQARQRLAAQAQAVMAVLERRLAGRPSAHASETFRTLLDRLATVSSGRHPGLAELVRQVHFRVFEEPRFAALREATHARALESLEVLAHDPPTARHAEIVESLVECPHPLVGLFCTRFPQADAHHRALMLEVLIRRYYRMRPLERVDSTRIGQQAVGLAEYPYEGHRVNVLATHARLDEVDQVLANIATLIARIPADDSVVVDLFVAAGTPVPSYDEAATRFAAALDAAGFGRPLERMVIAVAGCDADRGLGSMLYLTFRPGPEGYVEDRLWRGLHRMMGKRLELWRLANFDIERLPSAEDVYLLRGVARENPKDERLFAFVEVRDLTPVRDAAGRVVEIPHLDRMVLEAVAAMRDVQARRPARERLSWNRLYLYCWPPLTLSLDEVRAAVERIGPAVDGLGLEKVVVRGRMPDPETGALREQVLHVTNPGGRGFVLSFRPLAAQPIPVLTSYEQQVVQLRQRGLVHPYEIVRLLAQPRDGRRTEFPPGEFVEHDLDADGRLVPIERPYGQNKANIVVGTIRSFTPEYPEGMLRVILLGDPSRSMGALAEPECRRINAALDLAAQERVPLEWFALSAGAKISMESGTENMDWIARVLRRLIEFTQAGGEVNVVVVGINVGAQPYWNAEATMLMHTRGILVMTPEGAMVLTGKQALDYSGSVSADDNFGIGGYDRVMGPNGQAQYRARNLGDACHILLRHYAHTYLAPGERFPRRAATHDPADRDVCTAPHGGSFATVGDVFSEVTNPGRKRPFEIRRVMQATVDRDHQPLERWTAVLDGEIAVVWDARVGGWPVCMLGIESRPLPRTGYHPADGPAAWTAGTLFPMASKKIARAVNAASANRPLVVLANLSGFDGSPESMRRAQLEYGAEIGRAVVNFRGPIVFVVISRYHGGAFVVFSSTLNEQMEAVALEGTYASVIGGAPAAAVVFAGEVDKRTRTDPRVQAVQAEVSEATGPARARALDRLEEAMRVVRSEKLGQVADEFDAVHTVQRALKTGSLHRIIPARTLRPYVIDAVERGIRRTLEGNGGGG